MSAKDIRRRKRIKGNCWRRTNFYYYDVTCSQNLRRCVLEHTVSNKSSTRRLEVQKRAPNIQEADLNEYKKEK